MIDILYLHRVLFVQVRKRFERYREYFLASTLKIELFIYSVESLNVMRSEHQHADNNLFCTQRY